MAVFDLVTKAENYWSLMPDFGEPGQVGEAPTIPEDESSFVNQVNKYSTEKNILGDSMAINPEWIKAGSSVLGAALGGGTSSSASSSQYVNFNNSGYTVATSGSKANGGSSIPWWGWVVAGVVVIKIFKRKKG